VSLAFSSAGGYYAGMELLTTHEVADELGITPRHVRHLVKEKVLSPAFSKLGGYLFSRTSVEREKRRRTSGNGGGLGRPLKRLKRPNGTPG